MTLQPPHPKDHSRVHYASFNHLFLYITERCQLRCGHCYMGNRLDQPMSMNHEQAVGIMRNCRKLGAKAITFVGGEPTLHDDLPQFVDAASDLGFNEINLDTNGQNAEGLFKIPPNKLNYVRVSIDGPDAETHETVRGKGTWEKAIATLTALVQMGYKTAITSTIFHFNVDRALRLLQLADGLGVHLINFHAFSEEGLGRSKKEWSLDPSEWISLCNELLAVAPDLRISVWFPPTWTLAENVPLYVSNGFNGCLGCSLDRLSVFPDGRCYICSLLFDQPLHFARFEKDGLRINKEQNEFELFASAVMQAEAPWLSGCPAERVLGRQTDGEMVSMCRCWKMQA